MTGWQDVRMSGLQRAGLQGSGGQSRHRERTRQRRRASQRDSHGVQGHRLGQGLKEVQELWLGHAIGCKGHRRRQRQRGMV